MSNITTVVVDGFAAFELLFAREAPVSIFSLNTSTSNPHLLTRSGLPELASSSLYLLSFFYDVRSLTYYQPESQESYTPLHSSSLFPLPHSMPSQTVTLLS
jgi:hypothetical protein